MCYDRKINRSLETSNMIKSYSTFKKILDVYFDVSDFALFILPRDASIKVYGLHRINTGVELCWLTGPVAWLDG